MRLFVLHSCLFPWTADHLWECWCLVRLEPGVGEMLFLSSVLTAFWSICGGTFFRLKQALIVFSRKATLVSKNVSFAASACSIENAVFCTLIQAEQSNCYLLLQITNYDSCLSQS